VKFLRCKELSVKALFSPEHGINGENFAGKNIKNKKYNNIPIFSLYGKTRRPTKKMLKNIDIIFFDIQDIGTRSYTYATTLFYMMEEAKKQNKEVFVFDRPNPMGDIIDGPILENKYRSFVGYINVPYCHGMTIGELALFFNAEYNINCKLTVVPMKGWKRDMCYSDTKHVWIPTSPNIPEPDTPFFYPMTGILGELNIVNIGIGYTLPFKIIGAPWINAKLFAQKLNNQKLKGVEFLPFYFKPFYGLYRGENCQGVKIIIKDKKKCKPVCVQYFIVGMLKSLYPKIFIDKLRKAPKKMFCMINGTDKVYEILLKEKFPAWKLIEFQKRRHLEFLKKRKKYLLY